MLRASPDSSQIDLFSRVEQFLRERDQAKLNDPDAWHNVFLDQVIRRVPEERFAELFDDATGRPNATLRLLVGMLTPRRASAGVTKSYSRRPTSTCWYAAPWD